jgi:hypothetical protein
MVVYPETVMPSSAGTRSFQLEEGKAPKSIKRVGVQFWAEDFVQRECCPMHVSNQSRRSERVKGEEIFNGTISGEGKSDEDFLVCVDLGGQGARVKYPHLETYTI